MPNTKALKSLKRRLFNMQTCLVLTIINKRTKERAELRKYMDGFLPFPINTTIETGLYMEYVTSHFFRCSTETLEVKLNEIVEEDSKFYDRIALLRDKKGWDDL